MARLVNRMRPVHPSEVLREDYLVPLGLSINALSVALCVPATRIHEIVKERRAVTADTAARLATQVRHRAIMFSAFKWQEALLPRGLGQSEVRAAKIVCSGT